MPNRCSCPILYPPGDPDISQTLYPEADPTGHELDSEFAFTEPPASLLWWMSPLQMTLDSLYCRTIACPSDPLVTALKVSFAHHPKQAIPLQKVLVEATARDFTQWDQWSALIASLMPVSQSAQYRDQVMSGDNVMGDNHDHLSTSCRQVVQKPQRLNT